jgi:SAM-dependent methyltransferase
MLPFIRFWLASFTHAPWDTGISPPELISFIQSHPAGRALDLGCGSGTNALTLARHGWQVTGVDFIARSIRAARQRARQANLPVQFQLDSVTRLRNISGPFDLILDIGCYHGLALKHRTAYQRNLQRLLAPGGTYLLYGFLGYEDLPRLPGIFSRDISSLNTFLRLASRVDGTDRGRPSTWLSYRRAPESDL